MGEVIPASICLEVIPLKQNQRQKNEERQDDMYKEKRKEALLR